LTGTNLFTSLPDGKNGPIHPMVKLPVNQAEFPGKEISLQGCPFTSLARSPACLPAGKAGLAGDLPVTGGNPFIASTNPEKQQSPAV
jgi:hypothetical protein